MNVINWYIVKEVLKGSFAALVVLLTLFTLFTFSDELKDIGKGDYRLREILLFLFFDAPTVMYELMPTAALLGSLFVLGAMANNRELVAMQAAGLSIFGIIKAVMMAGLILAIFAIGVGEFIAPEAEYDAMMIRSTAQEKQVVLQTRYGLWLREGNVFINVRQVAAENKLADISVFELNKDYHLVSMVHAAHADFVAAGRWKFNQIQRTDVVGERIVAATLPQGDFQSSIDPALLNMVVVSADNLSLYDLAMYVDFLKKNNQKSQLFELAFWGRVVNPLVIFVMLLVSAPFVIGIKRGVSVGARIMVGVLIGMGFNVFDKIAGHLGLVYDLNPALMAVLPSALVLSISLIAIAKLRV
ncbi:MAG: LPS export ABC transporter permease LptG [Methylococcaceae bacterium]|nr:LPS export ABC transporter permease LptG [Methylococcaceae bacterium]